MVLAVPMSEEQSRKPSNHPTYVLKRMDLNKAALLIN